jgi:large subunit ribosomal protein L13
MVIYIDATDMVLGRLSSIVAKKLLEGEEVVILNAENTAIVGNKYRILAEFKEKREIGSSRKGPFYPRMPDRIVKRTIRGMLPRDRARGRMALKRLKVYIGTPPEFKDVKTTEIEAKVKGIKGTTYITVGDVSRYLGAKF